MRTYEALFIVRPDKADEEVQAIANEVEKQVTDDGGAIVRSEIWGKRRLAYEVETFNEGSYVLIRFQSQPQFPKALESSFRLNESVIRYLVVYFDEHTLKLEAEQQRRNEKELNRAGGASRDDEDNDAPMPRRPARPAEASAAPEAEEPAAAATEA